METFVNKYYTTSVKLTKLLYLNILWVVFTLLGLGFFGLMPATLAMFSVTRKWLIGETDIPVFKTFWETYKKEFLKSNLIGLFFLVTGYLLLVAYRILTTQVGIPYVIASYMVIGLLIVLLMVISYFFPIYVHFDLKTLDYIRWPLIIGINHPIITFILLVGVTVLNYLLLRFIPGVLLFLGGSMNAYIINWAVSKVYPLYSRGN